ncbi:MAG: hypothetical protein A3I44_05865 [Candidatus Sungbacteria bacterium RIFCSPLOWO2_02_FULL_51_17]|uniref:Glycosyltransferase 2-like domain-containing protein n=1 Tax=Candidatus Sungbacteria bacterium RIFCSPHIGHO2_02_FULL_51_29 TaxID=1802273 RepID=A0A1G2KRD3_9BACT|nr:MAG: hypothetical protein A2676_03575 [Candidatus Sungbacteria bacterium RIFCSPHIGHO2_01_FULL_51_22]OHA01834.1 MAG: hypothetical protein A3C16_05975 [Candidatus Sungbacteria bacterium RIFCSPHIGHO2_02_FULL_51_29]OHA04727.1 MAG: hypothetical protein A3B29_02575 [Candidatus Sungbacteria bacterium RIFCSPLOWO2_01_FULL_51_34]OHA12376.1 MAG: hypothetical protein A3I44_05865 [Candidatus Sungbacteria bacterium RIFCSPLOWO2_02_FULL_51_17]
MRTYKVVAVMPAYRAVRTLKKTVDAIPTAWVDEVILVDDASSDDTAAHARSLGIKTVVHPKNRGYGGNQKTCYREALAAGADIVVMVHPDFQYDPAFIPELIRPIAEGAADAMFGSRMLIPGGARKGGMPLWKYIANIVLTKIGNAILGLRLSEYHSGFRAYSRVVLGRIPFELNSDNFVFDTEIIAQVRMAGFRIGEIPITTRYFPEASMIGFWKSVQYGFSFLSVLLYYLVSKLGVSRDVFRWVASVDDPCPGCGERRHQLLRAETEHFHRFRENREAYRITEGGNGHGAIVRCTACSLSFVPRSTLPDLAVLYGSQPLDDEYVREGRGRRRTAAHLLKKISRAFGGHSGMLLDVGCGPGFFVDEARRIGWDAHGIEMGEAPARFARTHLGLSTVTRGGLEHLAAMPDGTISVITAWDVIEHLGGPMEFLRVAGAKLQSGGILALSAPRFDSIAARMLGEHWEALLPSHITYFTLPVLKAYLEKNGFHVASARSYWRFFSLQYIFHRIFGRGGPGFLHWLIVPVNLFDEMEVYAKKK